MQPFEILLGRGLLTSDDVERLRRKGEELPLDQAAVDARLVTEDAVLQAYSEELCIPYIEPSRLTVDQRARDCLTARAIDRHQALPYAFDGEHLLVAVADPFQADVFDELRMLSGRPIRIVLARREELRRAIKEHVGLGGGTLEEMSAKSGVEAAADDADDASLAEDASVMRLVNELLSDAFSRRASDVHIEPTPGGATIRYRIDGLLQPELTTSELNRFRLAIVSRIKIMAKLNIAERRLPQDGRIRLHLASGEKDVRVSIIPMLHGEGVVMRLLDSQRSVRGIDEIELPPAIATPFNSLIRSPHGIILVTGPTGSGKTTTLYAALATLRSPQTKIVTIEDPVEYELPGVNQIQVQSKVGLTFAAGLRSVLRHDPDIILVGEIRDEETARSAIQAALTGHLVFSTLHTNDALGAYTRLIDMGIEPYLAAGTVIGVLAQRLVRRLCLHCRTPYAPLDAELPLDFPRPIPRVLWRAVGCRECQFTGYSGRSAVFEFVRSAPSIRDACQRRSNAAELHAAALAAGFEPLRRDGWNKVLEGVTTIEEVDRVSGAEWDPAALQEATTSDA